jgi:hypothetical protein
MATKEIELTLDRVLNAILNWAERCDGDELARMTGELFGGDCSTENGETFSFTPNENYFGQFGDIE